MKIIILHYSAPPVVGGVESVIDHHARLMTNDGQQVSVIAGRGAKFDERIPFYHFAPVDSTHPQVLAIKKELDGGTVSPRFGELVEKIKSGLLELLSNADILIAHNVCSLNKNLALTAALNDVSRKNKTLRLILWHHDLAWTTPRYRKELHEGHPWDLLKTAWPNAVQVTISDARQEELSSLMSLPKSQITVVPNGVDVEKFFKLEEQTRAYVREFDLLQAGPLLLLPVRITPRKNIELALKILARLRTPFPTARLLVTGPLGPHNPQNKKYFERLRALRAELGLDHAAHFLAGLTDEYVPDAVISDFYKLADVLLFPSMEEGFGIPILEAGFAGLPVFCSDIPPLRKLGGNHAIYFKPDEDPQAVANMITEHLQASRIYGLRAEVRLHFTWESIYKEKIAPLLRL